MPLVSDQTSSLGAGNPRTLAGDAPAPPPLSTSAMNVAPPSLSASAIGVAPPDANAGPAQAQGSYTSERDPLLTDGPPVASSFAPTIVNSILTAATGVDPTSYPGPPFYQYPQMPFVGQPSVPYTPTGFSGGPPQPTMDVPSSAPWQTGPQGPSSSGYSGSFQFGNGVDPLGTSFHDGGYSLHSSEQPFHASFTGDQAYSRYANVTHQASVGNASFPPTSHQMNAPDYSIYDPTTGLHPSYGINPQPPVAQSSSDGTYDFSRLEDPRDGLIPSSSTGAGSHNQVLTEEEVLDFMNTFSAVPSPSDPLEILNSGGQHIGGEPSGFWTQDINAELGPFTVDADASVHDGPHDSNFLNANVNIDPQDDGVNTGTDLQNHGIDATIDNIDSVLRDTNLTGDTTTHIGEKTNSDSGNTGIDPGSQSFNARQQSERTAEANVINNEQVNPDAPKANEGDKAGSNTNGGETSNSHSTSAKAKGKKRARSSTGGKAKKSNPTPQGAKGGPATDTKQKGNKSQEEDEKQKGNKNQEEGEKQEGDAGSKYPGPRQHGDGVYRTGVRVGGAERDVRLDSDLVAAIINFQGSALMATTERGYHILHQKFVDPSTGKSVLKSFYDDQQKVEPGSDDDHVWRNHLISAAIVRSALTLCLIRGTEFFSSLDRVCYPVYVGGRHTASRPRQYPDRSPGYPYFRREAQERNQKDGQVGQKRTQGVQAAP